MTFRQQRDEKRLFDHLTGHRGVLEGVLADWARVDPEKTFCEDGRRTLSYGDFDRQIDRAANGLIAAGVDPQTTVGVLLQNSAEFLIAMLATHRAAAVHVPISTLHTDDEIAFQLRHARVRVAIVGSEWCVRIDSIRHYCPELATIVVVGESSLPNAISWDDLCAFSEQKMSRDRAGTNDLATIMYSSGTTERPKGIMFTHGNLVVAGHNMVSLLGWSRDERFLHFYPMFHGNGGITSVAPAIVAGASLVLRERFSSSRFSADLVSRRITLCHVSASHVRMLLNTAVAETDACHSVRRMLLGLSLPESDIEKFEQRFFTHICPIYGLTEVPGLVTATTPGEPRRAGTAGRPRRGLTIRVVSDEGAALPPEQVGELIVHGNQRHELTAGYFRDRVHTAKVYRAGWLHTGDLGSVDSDGYFTFVSRKKDLIKRSGLSISPAEVERVIREMDNVSDCAVVGTPDQIRGEAVVAFVALNSPDEHIETKLREHCQSKLAQYKIPQAVEVISSLPRNFVGKVDRETLRSRAAELEIVRDRGKAIHPSG